MANDCFVDHRVTRGQVLRNKEQQIVRTSSTVLKVRILREITGIQYETQTQLLHMNPFTHQTTKHMPVLNSCSSTPLLQLMLEIGTAVISADLSFIEHLSQTNTSCIPKFCYQSVYCFIRYFLVRIRIAKCFTNISKRFRYEVTFENEHSFWS
jgi:hypothetical protein